jgi:hypothetical protein
MIGLVGFDRTVVRELRAEHAAWMYGLAAAGLLGVVLVAIAGAYELGLLFERRAGYALGLAFTLLFALNMLRLLNAGLGATAGLPFAVWRPKLVAVVLSWFVAALLAQPLVTLVMRDMVNAVIAVRRDAVVTLHREQLLGALAEEARTLDERIARLEGRIASMEASGIGYVAPLKVERAELEARLVALEERRRRAEKVELPAFAASVQRAGFVADRIRAAWQSPWAASGLTILFATLITLGGVLRWPARAAVRAYEEVRHRRERALIERAYAENKARCGRLFGRYATFEAIKEWYEDPPYNTQPATQGPAPTSIEWEQLMERLRGQAS